MHTCWTRQIRTTNCPDTGIVGHCWALLETIRLTWILHYVIIVRSACVLAWMAVIILTDASTWRLLTPVMMTARSEARTGIMGLNSTRRMGEEFSARRQTGSGAHPTFSTMSNGVSFPGAKAAGAWSWPVTSNKWRGQENVDLYIHYPHTPSWCNA
jgi:hypothetical protein